MTRALVITSHARNATARQECLRSLPSPSPLPIIVVIGGHDAHDAFEENGVTVVHVTHNSIDFTGLIALLELPALRHDSYFYVHDTTRAGPGFIDRILSLPDYDTASFALPSMNIGLYSHAALERHRDTVLGFKNTCECDHEHKKLCVAQEDCVFRANRANHVFLTAFRAGHGPPQDYYGTGVLRVAEYYACVDLWKLKANWELKETYELGV